MASSSARQADGDGTASRARRGGRGARWLYGLLGAAWIVHAVLVAGLLAWAHQGAPLPPAWEAAIAATPTRLVLLLTGVIAAVAVLYGSGRLAIQAGLTCLAYLALALAPRPELGVVAAALLLPVNLFAATILEEASPFSRAGVVRTLALAAQASAVGALLHWGTPLLDAIARIQLLPGPLRDWSHLPDQGLLLGTLAAGALLVHAAASPRPEHTTPLGILVCTGLGLHLGAEHGAGAAEPVVPFLLGLLLVVAAVLQKAHGLAFRDALTGLPNRRAMEPLMARLSPPFTIAMVDVDHFKDFNDTYGHEVGDQVLRRVGTALARVEGGGRPFRYGGEEFAIVFPHRGKEEVRDALEALRRGIAERPFRVRSDSRPADDEAGARLRGRSGRNEVTITVSIGVADGACADNDPEATQQAADEALYRAKRQGRNRVAAY